jgi:hypothetical protein
LIRVRLDPKAGEGLMSAEQYAKYTAG